MRNTRSAIQRYLSNPLLQRVLRNTSYLFSAQTFSAGLSMVQGIMAARLLGVEGAGLVGIITQFSSNLNRLISFRMGELVISFVGEFSAQKRDRHAAAVFKAAALTEIAGSIVAFILVVALAPLGASLFAHQPELASLFAVYGLSVLANFMAGSATGLLEYFNHFKTIALITVGQSLLTVGLITGAFLTGGGLMEVVLAYLGGKIVWALSISSVAVYQAFREWGGSWWRAPLGLLTDRRRDLVRFAVSTNLSGTLKLITRDSEMLWLGAFSTPLQVGYYKIAKAITNVLMTPVSPLIKTTYREVAREVADRHWVNVRYLLRSGSILAAGWTIPASLGLVMIGRWVIGLYGPEFLPISYQSLLILLIGAMAANIFYWSNMVLLPMGMPDYPTKVQFVAAIAKVGLTITLVPKWGANGMALLLSGFLLSTTLGLVWKSLREIRKFEMHPAMAPGD